MESEKVDQIVGLLIKLIHGYINTKCDTVL